MQKRMLAEDHQPSESRYVAPRVLNSDILLFIIAISPLHAATSMMATCHFLYHEGAKIILRNNPMSFDQDTSVDEALALLRFIQAEHLSRCPQIRELRILMPSVPHALSKALIPLVPRMTSLKFLSLAIEDALDAHPDLLPAFSSLRSVKQLLLTNAGRRSCELLKAFQSVLTEAEIYFDSTRAALCGVTAYHPLVMLQRSAPTLAVLVVGCFVDINVQLVFARPPDVVYPALHTLVLHECAPLSLAPYIKCCPNLISLWLKYEGQSPLDDHSDHLGHDGEIQTPTADMSQRQREMNLTLPGRLLDPTAQYEPPAWKRLDEYIGPLMDLWVLGLTCPIACLKLEDAFASLSSGARAPTALTDVLAYARPTELAIVFRRCTLTDFLATDFLDALATEGAAGLRSLMLAVWVREGDRDLDMGHALDKIVEAVSHLNLTRLDIGINDGGIGGYEKEASDELNRFTAIALARSRAGTGTVVEPEAASAAAGNEHATTQAHASTLGATSSNDHDSPSGASAADSDSDSDSGQGTGSGSHQDSDTGSGSDLDVDSGSDEGSDSDADLHADPESESGPLSLGERTLDAVDVPAFAMRLADAIPTLEDSLVGVPRPRRCEARLRFRTAMFGRVIEGEGARAWRWVGDVLYQETEGPFGA